MRINRFLPVVLFILLSLVSSVFGQQVGDAVRLASPTSAGVPVHPAPGDNSYVRWDNGTIGIVSEIDDSTGWYHISSADRNGWVTKKYLSIVPGGPDEESSEGQEILSYLVGTWNLECFQNGVSRGFPENTHGGKTYPPRTGEDIRYIADIIETRIGAGLLVLCEIGAGDNGRSDEMDALVSFLGSEWVYELSKSGLKQHVAILYDSRKFRKEACKELEVPETKVQGSDILVRDPLVGMFACLDGDGNRKNDFIVAAVHLASGQDLKANHNEAMKVLSEQINQALTDGTFPQEENDILIMGDFNASRYDTHRENFWTDYRVNNLPFLTLASESLEDYFCTRLGGNPLLPKSPIDYILASEGPGGMTSVLVQLMAHVHSELLTIGCEEFRSKVSDHLPVTVRIQVRNDDD